MFGRPGFGYPTGGIFLLFTHHILRWFSFDCNWDVLMQRGSWEGRKKRKWVQKGRQVRLY